jgi:NTP pyrophosphatase (non-canonical NTP hydrolase)
VAKALTFDEYAQIVDETCVVDPNVLRVYSALGLFGEVGECAAYAASKAEDGQANTVLTAAVLLGEIAEVLKKSQYRGDKIDPEVVSATVIESALAVIDLMGVLLSLTADDAEDASELEKAAHDRLRCSRSVFVSVHNEAGAVKEAGDVLWYLAAFSKARGFSLAEAAEKNMTKLRRRKSEGKIRGSGSER